MLLTRMLKLNLEARGEYQVKVEPRADRVLATAKRFRPHVILLDLIMPRRSGEDVARELEKDGTLQGVPIIFLSATAAKRTVLYRRPLLPKPSAMAQLVSCIEEQLALTHEALHADGTKE